MAALIQCTNAGSVEQLAPSSAGQKWGSILASARAASRNAEATPIPIESKKERKPVVIISDPADFSDDNIAILMLLRSGQLDVRGIITTGGNVCSERGAVVASHLLQGLGVTSIPVVEGFSLAWHEERRAFYEQVERPSWQRQSYVGAFSDAQTCDAAEARRADDAAPENKAVDFLLAQAHASKGGLTIILTAPATILAEAFRREPGLSNLIRRVDAMGGTIKVEGNVTAHAEFNVWFDPAAMETVLASGVPMTLVPLDATANLTYQSLARPHKKASHFAATYLGSFLERKGLKGKQIGMWDEVLAAIVLDPGLIEASQELWVSVSLEKDERFGKIVSSPVSVQGASRPIEVVTKVRGDGVRQLIERLLLLEDR